MIATRRKLKTHTMEMVFNAELAFVSVLPPLVIDIHRKLAAKTSRVRIISYTKAPKLAYRMMRKQRYALNSEEGNRISSLHNSQLCT